MAARESPWLSPWMLLAALVILTLSATVFFARYLVEPDAYGTRKTNWYELVRYEVDFPDPAGD